jgi:uncharacterized protein (TIGR02145 family)
MKKLYLLIAFIVTIATFAQAPQGFNYQATVRNSSGALITNQNVYFKFNVMLNSSTSVPVYSETHYVPTDDLGAVNLVIGQGTATTGTFSAINWGSGNYYMGIELNTGSGYIAMGTTQLLSVPYALYANTAGNSQASIPNLASVLAVNNGANNLQIKNLSDPSDAQDAVTKSYIDAQLQAQVAQLQAQITALQNANVAPLPNVTIGTQIWSSTNLDVTTYRDGTPIPQVTDPTQWANLTTGAWCYYNNDPANGAIYGKLYNWYAVAGIYDAASLANPSLRKQFAPTGWHVPSDAELSTLINYLDPVDGVNNPNIAGGKMKEAGTTHWTSPNTGATNESGFTGLPGGLRDSFTGAFQAIGTIGEWYVYPLTFSYAFILGLSNNDRIAYAYADATTDGKKIGKSIRCVKD